MLREIDLAEVSDGRLYSSNDMAKTDCKGCIGCSDCCRGMGASIVLDPLDSFRISEGLHVSFEQLLSDSFELGVVDGLILPHLKMAGPKEACTFLTEEGRCSIHSFRPGICRIFPLGRFYEKNSFQYFLQVHECPKTDKAKVKIKKWIDTPNLKTYETYISDWHYFLKHMQDYILSQNFADTSDSNTEDDGIAKTLSMHVLKQFYLTPYQSEEDFYPQFYERLEKSKLFFHI